MAKRTGGAMHVATTTRRYKDTVYHTHLLRRSVRGALQRRSPVSITRTRSGRVLVKTDAS